MARTAAVALLAVVAGAIVTPAQARWARPFQFSPPASLDIIGPQLAFSPSGLAAVGFTLSDQDNPANTFPEVVWRSSSGALSSPRAIPESLEVLGLAWTGRTVVLLTGNAPATETCCSAAGVMTLNAAGKFGSPRRLVHQLGGATVGTLVPLGQRMLAAIATERGVWVAQSSRNGRWGSTRRLAGGRGGPAALAATAGSNGGADVAWIGGAASDVGSRNVYVAGGSATRPPRRAHPAVTAARGRGIDELGIAPGPGGATVAWIESWFDRRGEYHSEVVASDLAHPRQTWSFPIAGTVASGLGFAGDRRGDQLIAWKACTWSAACSTRAVVRTGGRRFGRPQTLGSIDGSEVPSAAVSSSGEGLVGWIDRGHVLAREHVPHGGRFFAAQTVSSTSYAASLAVGFGPASAALAAWSQGTLSPDVVGALYRR